MAGFSPEILAYLGGVVPGAPPAPDGGTCDQDTLEQIYDFYEKNLKRKYPDPAASLGTAIGNISPHPFLLKNLPCVMSLTQKPGTWTLLEEYVVAAYVKEGWLMAQAALKAAELSLQEAESTGNEDFKKGARKYALIAKLIIYTLMGPQAKDRPTMERKELDEITAFHNTPPRLLEYLKVLGMLVDGASKAPRYDREKNQMPGQHLYEYGTYHLPLKDSDPILRPSSLSSAMLSCQAILGLGKKDPASMKVGIDALEKIRAEFPMIDKKTPALIYDDCFFPDPKADVSLIAPHCASRGNYTDEALGIDFKLATAYAEAGNPTEALTHLQYMITGQDPDHPARSEYAKPPQEFPYRRERIKNFAGAIPILFQIIKGAAEKAKTPEEVQANIEDARALYLYFLNPGSPRPRFKGTYAKQADQILGALLKYEGTILLIQKDPAGLDANDKDMRKQLLLVIKPAEMQKATESIYLDVAWEALRVARDFLGDEKEGIQATAENPDLALPYLAKARVLLEKFKPEGKISPEMLDDARGDLALLATLYVRWADRTVEEKLGPGVSASMRDMLEPEVKKKLEAAEEALAVFYAPPFNGIGFDNVSQKTGVKSRGGVGTLLYIASVYTGLANSMATNSQSFSSAEKYLKEADRVLRRAQGHVNIMNTEEQASPPETLGYIAVVYAKLAEKNKIIDKDESRRFAEIAIKYAVECENTPGGSKKALLSVLISVAPVYVYLGDFAKAKDLLGRVFKEGLGGGANPDLALKALSSLSWIYSEELKSLSENRETDPQKERELELKRRELALKSALLMYALVYGKAGGPEISWEALGSGNMDSAEVAALRNKDGVFNNYFSLTKDYSKQIVDAGNLSERGNSIFDNLEMPNGKTDLIFKLANALRELSKNSKHDDIKALRKAAIKLCEQVFDVLKLKGDKLSEKARKTLRDAIWVLAGLTGERIWVDKLRAELPKVKNPETRVDMTLTVASGYFALGIAEQKKGNKAEAQKLFDDSLSLYEEALRRGTEGKHPALSNHEVLDVLLKEVELFKVQKNFKRAQELLLQVSLKAEEEIQKTTEKKPPKAELIIAQLGLSKLLARLTTVEVTIAEIKQSLFRKEIDEKEALRLLTAQKEVFLQVLADEEGGKGGLNSKEAAELTAISVRTAVVLYGSLGGVSADSMEGGTLFFLEASGIIAAFLGKKIDGIGLDQLAKKDSSFKPVADMIQKALNNTSLWQGMDQIGYTEERLLVTGGDLLAEAGKTHPELLAQAVDFYTRGLKGIGTTDVGAMLLDEQNFYLEARLGWVKAKITIAQQLLIAADVEKAEAEINAALAEVEALKNLVEAKGPMETTVYLGNLQKIYTTLVWAYGVKGGIEEAKTNGDGKGRIFFKKAQEIYEKFLINLSNPWPYLASQPCMAAVVLEETEVQPLQLLFSYVEVLRAALKQGKDDLDLGPDKEATIAKMLEFYGLLQASFTNPWDKKLVKAAELEFKLGLAAYYKANSRLDLWKKYIGEVLVALEDEPRLLQETPPATEKEATAVLHLRLLRGSALMAQADQLFSVFAETEEVKKLWEEAVKTYSLILKESSGQRLKKMGRTIYDVQIEYLRSSMKLPKFESNPVFMQILKQIEKLEETRKTRELSPEERKFFIQACITIGDAYIWDEKIKDPAKAKLYYDRAESEEKEIKDLAKREVSWLKDALASMYKGQAWTALEISKGTGTAVTLGSAKASQEAEQKFGRLRDLYKDKPNLNPKEIEMLAFAYYGLGELALRGGQAPNYALAIEEYKEALKVLKGNQDPRTGDYKDIDSAKRALAIYNGLADASKGHRKFGDAKTYFESAQKVLEQIKAQISILSEGRAAVEDPKWVKKAEDQIFTGLMRLPKEERALSSYVRATGEVATSSQGDQGVEETAAGGGVAGEVKIPIDDTQTVGVAVAVTGRKLNRSVTSDPKLSNAKAMADIDKQITDLQKEIDALGPTVSRETYLFRMKGLEEDKKQLQEAASKGEKEPLLTSIADMRTSMDIWWEKTFGKVGMLRLDLMGDQNTVWYNTSGRQATQTFLAERLGLKGRFTFTGFQPVAEKWFFQPYAELAGFLGIANKKSGLVEMQTDSAEDNKQWTDGPGAATLAERQKDVSGGALELDYAAALGLQVVRPGIRLGSWGTLDLLGTVEGKYSRDAWGRRAGLFWPGTVTHPSYFVDPTETRKRDLDVTFWTLKMGFDPTLYLCNGNLVISPSISSEFFFREIASRGWSVTARLGIDFYFWEKFPFSVNFNFNTGKQEQSLPWAKDGGEGSQSVFTKWRTYTFDLSWYF